MYLLNATEAWNVTSAVLEELNNTAIVLEDCLDGRLKNDEMNGFQLACILIVMFVILLICVSGNCHGLSC